MGPGKGLPEAAHLALRTYLAFFLTKPGGRSNMEIAKSLAFSATGGLVMGLVGCAGGEKQGAEQPAADSTAPAAADAPAAAEGGAKECCKGRNSCKGKGGCKVDGANECKGMNECKGKGGCKSGDCGGE